MVIGGVLLLGDDDNQEKYDTSLNDGEYNLEDMSLRIDDMPADFVEGEAFTFTNEEWATVIVSRIAEELEDPEAELARVMERLDAQGRKNGSQRLLGYESPEPAGGRSCSSRARRCSTMWSLPRSR